MLFLFDQALAFIREMPWQLFLMITIMTMGIEMPRYTIGFVAALFTRPWEDIPENPDFSELGKISLIIAGHNEEDAIERCVRSLDNQTFKDFEIICVDDGSTDKTFEIMTRLEREGLIHRAVRLELRGGKASALNMATRLATGNIYIILDADSKLETDAVEEVLKPLFLPGIDCVSGTVLLANTEKSWVTHCQAIEYAIGIPLGRTLAAMLDQLVMVSGAFGAFRASAWKQVGGMDVGPGEDFDICLRLRKMGYGIGFNHKSICYTEAPHLSWNLVRQRLRWERDAVWLRFRKHRDTLNPFHPNFRVSELIHQAEFLLVTILPSVIFPLFVVWMLLNFEFDFALMALMMAQLVLIGIDVAGLFMAAWLLKKPELLKLLVWIPINSVFTAYVMRSVKVFSYIDEWINSRSLQDDFSPFKVQNWGTGYR
jgi:cellulose synthase/poly-beta-1,6-N-acetylglucosamine synthase-like glycosyltransferase